MAESVAQAIEILFLPPLVYTADCGNLSGTKDRELQRGH